MKRDLNLIRELLLKIDDAEDPDKYSLLSEYDKRDEEGNIHVSYIHHQHLRLMKEARLVVENSNVCSLTPYGIQCADLMRDNARWYTVMAIKEKVSGITFAILMEILEDMVRDDIERVVSDGQQTQNL